MRLEHETVTSSPPRSIPGVWPGVSTSGWERAAFEKALRLVIGRRSGLTLEFDVVGIDASMANAIRRVLLAEVPTVAVENVYIWNNTSLVQDEVLSQRLGLVPLKIDPKKVEFKGFDDEPTDLNTIVFSMVIKCDRRPNPGRGVIDPDRLYNNAHVYSSAFAWQAKGVQSDTFADDPPRPVYNDVLLAKLRPNQEIILEMHCEKGIGKDHAKWSPVATASYRLLPTIDLVKAIKPEHCDKFAQCFPPGVVEVQKADDGGKFVKIVNPRKDTVSREVLRHPEFQDSVKLGRRRDHFIFNVESVGQIAVGELVPTALDILLDKVRTLRSVISELR